MNSSVLTAQIQQFLILNRVFLIYTLFHSTFFKVSELLTLFHQYFTVCLCKTWTLKKHKHDFLIA